MKDNKLSVKQKLFPRRAMAAIERKSANDHEKYIQNMSELSTRIEESGITLSDKEKLQLEGLVKKLQDRKLSKNEQISLEITMSELYERSYIAKAFADEAKQIYDEHRKALVNSKNRSDALFGILAREFLVIASSIVLSVFIGLYIYYKINVPQFGMDTKPEFYSIVAQILPAVLIALFLTGDENSKDSSRNKRSVAASLMSSSKFLGLAGFILGEAACLFAIQRGYTGTGVYLFAMGGLLLMGLITITRIIGIDRHE